MASNTPTLGSVSGTAAGTLERTGVDPQRVTTLLADTRDQALKLGQEAVERAAAQREQVGEAVRNVIQQLPAVSVEVTVRKPGRFASRNSRIALVIVSLFFLALIGFSVAKWMRGRAGDQA